MSQEILLTVQSAATLNEFLRERLQERFGQAASNSKVRRLIFSQNVFVCAASQNQASRGGGFFVCKNPSFALKKNARVKVLLDEEKFFYQKENDDIKFELDGSRVLYEDDAIIVVNKPPRFPSEATFVHDRDNLQAAVVRYLHNKIGLDKNPPYCGMVHRLDRDTSGVILFSKQRAANAALFAAFASGEEEGGDAAAERAAQKIYAAICAPAGSPRLPNDSFSVQNYLGRVSPKSQAAKWGTVPKEKGGKYARTDFKILEKKGGLIFVQAKLWTGRTHQIRVHLAQSGLAILGDELYGGRPAERIFLHAQSLDLPHPITGAPLHFEAPLPPEFLAAF